MALSAEARLAAASGVPGRVIALLEVPRVGGQMRLGDRAGVADTVLS